MELESSRSANARLSQEVAQQHTYAVTTQAENQSLKVLIPLQQGPGKGDVLQGGAFTCRSIHPPNPHPDPQTIVF